MSVLYKGEVRDRSWLLAEHTPLPKGAHKMEKRRKKRGEGGNYDQGMRYERTDSVEKREKKSTRVQT